jgi:hypothetical protein
MASLEIEGFGYIFDCVKKEVDAGRLGPKGKAFYVILESKKSQMFRNYITVRDSAKVKYMQNPKGFLDRHKCAAIFMIAFLNQISTVEDDIFKEIVAIGIGLLILKIFVNSPNTKYLDPPMVAYIEANGFKFPTCKHDDGFYLQNWALGIHYDYIDGKLSVLSLANALFMVEMYNRQLAGLD